MPVNSDVQLDRQRQGFPVFDQGIYGLVLHLGEMADAFGVTFLHPDVEPVFGLLGYFGSLLLFYPEDLEIRPGLREKPTTTDDIEGRAVYDGCCMGIVGDEIGGAVSDLDALALLRKAIQTLHEPVREGAFFAAAGTGNGTGHEFHGSPGAATAKGFFRAENADQFIQGIETDGRCLHRAGLPRTETGPRL